MNNKQNILNKTILPSVDLKFNSSNEAKFNFKPNTVSMVSYILIALTLISVLKLQLVSLLFSITLTYIFIDKIGYLIFKTSRFIDNDESHLKLSKLKLKIMATILIGIFIIATFALFGAWAIDFLSPSNLKELFGKIETILETQKNSQYLPSFIYDYLPSNFTEVKNQSIDFLKNYSAEIKNVSKYSITFLAYIILGCIIGCMLNLSVVHEEGVEKHFLLNQQPSLENENQFNQTQNENNNIPLVLLNDKKEKLLSKFLIERIVCFKESFELIFLAQIKISLVNTILTASYIYVFLPLFDYHLPFKSTLVLLTFLFGLIPVLGNLITNTIIIVLSLGISLNIALISLAFLVIIHKLEYFLDAKIIGNQIQAKTWEILLVLIIFETLFGISGIIVGSIYYCYLKRELQKLKLI